MSLTNQVLSPTALKRLEELINLVNKLPQAHHDPTVSVVFAYNNLVPLREDTADDQTIISNAQYRYAHYLER